MYAGLYDDMLPWYRGNDPTFKDPFDCPISADCPQDPVTSHPFVAFRLDIKETNGNLRPMLLGCLYAANVIKEPRLFYCPSDTEKGYRYEDYLVPKLPNTSRAWGTLPQVSNTEGPPPYNEWVRLGYTYYPANIVDRESITFLPDNPIEQTLIPRYTPRTLSRVDGSIPYVTDRIWKRQSVEQFELRETDGRPKPLTHRTGRMYSLNALFKDNHTIYYKDQDIFRSQLWWSAEESNLTQPEYREFFYGIYRAIGKVGQPLSVAPYFK